MVDTHTRTSELDRDELRHAMRRARAALTSEALDEAGAAVAEACVAHLEDARIVSGYLAVSGELPLETLLHRCRTLGKITCLPRCEGTELHFHPVDEQTTLHRNRFGLLEPAADSPQLAADELDAVLLPLVAFDRQGNRLGMGGGFYDRCFAGRKQNDPPPLLIGIAHALQEVDALEPAPWDVPLDLVVTDRAVIRP